MWRISLEVCVALLLLAVLMFLFWRRLLRTRISDVSKRLRYAWVSTAVSTPFVYVALVLLLVLVSPYYPDKYFDKDRWSRFPETRYEMTGHIIESEMLIGKTKSEVDEILSGEGWEHETDVWRYYIGQVPGFVIDPDVLQITFKNGKVVEVQQYTT